MCNTTAFAARCAIAAQSGCRGWQPATKTRTAGDFMKLSLLSAIAASRSPRALLLPHSPNPLPPKPSHRSSDIWPQAQARRRRCVGAANAAKIVVGSRCDGASSRRPAVAGGRPYDSLIAIACSVERHSCRARASRHRAREPLSRQRDGPRRRQRADADQARDRARHGLHAAAPRACSIPTPTSPTACDISPAPIAPRAAHHGRAVGYYASGYYYAAKRQRARQCVCRCGRAGAMFMTRDASVNRS